MQRVRHIYLISLVFLWIGFGALSVFGQSAAHLFTLYQQNRILELKQMFDRDDISPPDWKEFVGALFEMEAESAIQEMINIYLNTRDRNLQKVIRQRVSLYYSARGIYGTANRILEDKSFFDLEIVPQWSERRQLQYGVQIGAFSTLENGQRAREKFAEDYPNTTIIERMRNGRKLYLVVIGGYPSREEAERVARILNNKSLKETYFTIQY